MATIVWHATCSQCGGKTTWCGDAGDPDAPMNDGEWIVCLSCLVFAEGIPPLVKRGLRQASAEAA